MPDQEMIDRVATAILDTPNASDYKTLVASNAIKAMREPTTRIKQVETCSINYSAEEIWTKFIDFIIK